MKENLAEKSEQCNSLREIYVIEGDSFDSQIIAVRGIQEITMMLYIAWLKDAKQPLFLDKTAHITKLGTYYEGTKDMQILRSKDYPIDFLLKKGEESFIKHDKEIDKMEMEKAQPKGDQKKE